MPKNRFHPDPILPLLLSVVLVTADDGQTIVKIASSFSPAPSGWSSTSSDNYCTWPGISCDKSSRITSINLPSKSLSGTLSSEISTLSELGIIYLQNNNLTGPIPSFANLSSLQFINLEKNAFTSVSSDAFSGLTNLQRLSLSVNTNLRAWTFPDLSQSTSLVDVQLDNTNLYGTVPDIFGSMSSLQSVSLSYNNLSGTLPASLGNSMIQNFWINNQAGGLTGTLEVISNMAQRSQVWLHKNMFTGPIPDLSKCIGIFDLQLRDNQLTGPVPESLIKLPNLMNVSLSDNKLQGPIPKFPRMVEKVDVSGTNNFCNSNGDTCDPQVNIFLEIAGGFGYPASLSDDWAGNDACKWLFVTCDTQGNAIMVNLTKKNLAGTISSAFGNLTALKTLNLNDNQLTGSIPDSLTKLSSLQLLDVSNNNLSGDIPKFSNSVKIAYSGNSLVSKSSGSGDGNSIALIVGIVVGVLIFAAALCFAFYKFMKKKCGIFRKMEGIVKDGMRGGGINGLGGVVISIQVLRQVTNNFSDANVLGRGGFGVVYKGELHDGTQVAVKRMECAAVGSKGLKEFQAEISVLAKVKHRHLVAILGYCINGNERLLIYEYMPQGTLSQHLFKWRDTGYAPLTWMQRVTIALDVAWGLQYLHSLAQQCFIHRDLKPSNILLGDDLRAKIADFGLVKNATDEKHSVETRVAGTFGYLAPEYARTGKVTTMVDVYAFGVILMEIITGRKSLDESLLEEQLHLVTWFSNALINKDNILEMVDETINCDEETMGSILKVAELAGHCTACEPYKRPDMGHAVKVLGPLVKQWKCTSQEGDEDSDIELYMCADISHSQTRLSIKSAIQV